MTSLVNKSADWPPNYHKILIFFPTTSLKCLRTARKDELADSKESAIKYNIDYHGVILTEKDTKKKFHLNTPI